MRGWGLLHTGLADEEEKSGEDAGVAPDLGLP